MARAQREAVVVGVRMAGLEAVGEPESKPAGGQFVGVEGKRRLIGPVAQFWVIPYMRSAEGRQTWGWLLGEGEARGMALVFLVAGLVSLGAVLLAFASRPYRRLSRAYAEAPASEGG